MRKDALKEQVQAVRSRFRGGESESLSQLADLLFKAGKIAAAMNLMERSLLGGEEDPESLGEGIEAGRRWFERSLEYADAFLYEDAQTCLNRAHQLGFDNFETRYCLAGVLKSLLRPHEAEIEAFKSLESNTRFSPAMVLLAGALKDQGRLDESVDWVKKALRIDPDCGPAHYDLACYYALRHEHEKALAALELAFCKGFVDFDWVQQDPDMGSLRQNPAFSGLLITYRAKYPA